MSLVPVHDNDQAKSFKVRQAPFAQLSICFMRQKGNNFKNEDILIHNLHFLSLVMAAHLDILGYCNI